MNTTDLWPLALATRAVLGAWFQEGGLFSRRRAYFEAVGGLRGKLMTCPFCLAFHVAFWLAVFFIVPAAVLDWLAPGPWGTLWKLPLYVFAAAAVVHLLEMVWPASGKSGGSEG